MSDYEKICIIIVERKPDPGCSEPAFLVSFLPQSECRIRITNSKLVCADQGISYSTSQEDKEDDDV